MCLRNKIYLIFLWIFVFLWINVSGAEQIDKFLGQVNGDNINIRADSTTSSAVICQANKGDYLEVIKELYDWYKVILPKHAPSFIKKELVAPIEILRQQAPTETDKLMFNAEISPTAKVLKNSVNIRLQPNESSPIIGKLEQNEIIKILEDKGGWYKIEPTSNSFGWINKKFVIKVNAKIESVKSIDKVQEENKEENINVEGIIKPYGKVFKRLTTHKLFTRDNRIYLLKGDKKSLDVLNYHNVRVTGKLNFIDKQKYPIIEILQVEAL